MAEEIFRLRKQELARRVANLPAEVQAWKTATENQVDQNAHFSQLRAIEVLMDTFVNEQRALLDSLNPAGDAEAFNIGCLNLVRSIIRSQKTWDFFRSKLELRYSPEHKEPLWVTDTIAWDCHRPVLNTAVQFGILDGNELREPPLVYCTAEYSPATWVRGSRPNDGRVYDLGEALLPIPVIEIPWDHLGNAWEYLALHHEVSHDIEADLQLRPVLQNALQQVLSDAGVPPARTQLWLRWEGEIFADLCGLQLAGPAFTEALMHLLLLPADNVKTFNKDDPHPTPYTRILLNAAYIRSLGNTPAIQDHAARIETAWKAVYGDNSGDPALDALTQDFSPVCKALMDTKFPILKGHAVKELMPFGEADDARIRLTERFFRTGMNRPNNLPLRHTVSAARLAVDTAAQAGTLSDEVYTTIHERVIAYVKETAPQGLRGGGPDAHEKFIASFAKRIFTS
jgi:hypothetical protein